MPERPDIIGYVEALTEHFGGQKLQALRIDSMFLLRSAVPPIVEASGQHLTRVSRLGKRIVFHLDGEDALVLHLMIAGRLRVAKKKGADIPKRRGLCAFDFESGTVILTEAGTKKRASLYFVRGAEALADHNPGGLELEDVDLDGFIAHMRKKNHTIKRALTDPRILSGIGNAYSDEILHRAQLSPVTWTSRLTDEQYQTLFTACCEVMDEWTVRLREERAGAFPDKVTAFHDEMAVHGKYKQPCPRCNDPVQRITYAKNETNYCATCQTEGKLLADRALSRLMKKEWPRSLEDLETMKAQHRGSD